MSASRASGSVQHRIGKERDRVHETERSADSVALVCLASGLGGLRQTPDCEQLEQRECDRTHRRLQKQNLPFSLYRERIGRQLAQGSAEERSDLRADDEAHRVGDADQSL